MLSSCTAKGETPIPTPQAPMFPKVWAQNSVHWNPGAQEPAFLMPFPYPPSCLRTPFEFHASFNPHIHDSRKIALCPFYRLGSRGSATAHGYPPWRRVYKPTHRRGGPGESAPRERIRKAEEFPSAPPLPHLAVLGRALISLGQKGDWERLCPRGPGCAP